MDDLDRMDEYFPVCDAREGDTLTEWIHSLLNYAPTRAYVPDAKWSYYAGCLDKIVLHLGGSIKAYFEAIFISTTVQPGVRLTVSNGSWYHDVKFFHHDSMLDVERILLERVFGESLAA